MKKTWVTIALIVLLCGVTAFCAIRIVNDSREKEDLSLQVSRHMDETKSYQAALDSANEQNSALQAELAALTTSGDEA